MLKHHADESRALFPTVTLQFIFFLCSLCHRFSTCSIFNTTGHFVKKKLIPQQHKRILSFSWNRVYLQLGIRIFQYRMNYYLILLFSRPLVPSIGLRIATTGARFTGWDTVFSLKWQSYRACRRASIDTLFSLSTCTRHTLRRGMWFHLPWFTCAYGTRICRGCCMHSSRQTLRKIITMTHTSCFIVAVTVYVITFYQLSGAE